MRGSSLFPAVRNCRPRPQTGWGGLDVEEMGEVEDLEGRVGLQLEVWPGLGLLVEAVLVVQIPKSCGEGARRRSLATAQRVHTNECVERTRGRMAEGVT